MGEKSHLKPSQKGIKTFDKEEQNGTALNIPNDNCFLQPKRAATENSDPFNYGEIVKHRKYESSKIPREYVVIRLSLLGTKILNHRPLWGNLVRLLHATVIHHSGGKALPIFKHKPATSL